MAIQSIENASDFCIQYADNRPSSYFTSLAEAKQSAEWMRVPCKIWAIGPNDGFNNWQFVCVEYVK